ncbi:MAG: Chromosome partition protein Smc [Firmicutes bacterium]|nr:Chromosome partition protein Smc [candidate division NPL-UPA2 bacterium]
MRMKRIELSGFKSFADRTEFELGEGLTAVVGPNGSGKSNLAEAVKWVLGEQSARLLRGTRMDDVIFCGTAKRKGVGLAEVTLVFDNSDKRLPIDLSEVAITRRVYRSGDAEYFINRKVCRLRDIAELFLDTGIGKESYSFVGQGRIEEILSADPRNRRVIFEEATGISRYKLRKKETEARLGDTAGNLRRIQDIAWELKTQLEPLAGEAERAKHYLELTDTRDSCERELLLYEVALAERQHQTLHTQAQRVSDEIIHSESRLNIHEAEQAGNLLAASVDLAAFRGVERELLQHTLLREQRSERLSDTAGEHERATSRLQNAAAALDRLLHEEARVTQDWSHATDELGSFELSLSEKSAVLKGCPELRVESLSRAEGEHAAYLTSLEESTHVVRGELAECETRTQVLGESIVRKTDQHTTLAGRLENLTTEQQQREKMRQDLSLGLTQTKAQHAETATRLRQLEGQTASLEQQRQRAEAEAHGALTRLRALEASERQMEGLSRGARYVLGMNMHGVLGAVGNLIATEERYEVAIEVALGAQVGDIVTDTESTAKRAIAVLKEKAQGRATFFPLDTLKPRDVRDLPARAFAVTGCLGRAADLVKFPAELGPVVRHTLGNALICDGLESASQVAAQTGYTWRIVTLDGDIVLPGGSITGGSRPERQAWMLSRRRELESTASLLEEKRSLEKSIVGEITELRAHLEQAVTLGRKLAGEVDRKEGELKPLLQAMARLSEEQRFLSDAVSSLAKELSQLKTEHGGVGTKVNRLRAQMAELTGLREKALRTAEELSQRQAANSVLRMELAVEVARLESQVALATLHAAERRQNAASARERREEGEREAGEAESAVAALKERMATLESEIRTLHCKVDAFTAQVEAGRLRQEQQTQSQAKLQAMCIELQGGLNNARQRLHNMELRRERVAAEEDFLKAKLRQKYPSAAGQSSTLSSRSEAETRITELDTKLTELGPVRIAAIAESERLSERISFLAREQDDLREAEQHLRGVMAELDQVMGERFVTGFSAIQKAFSDVAARLFGGATARIYLSEPERPLESGIEVDVQPLGKRLQSITLLSGGERALVALSLLCAVLLVKPTPFCVLDEIDAPLDEANVERLIVVLRELCANTQFLIITHTRGTMMAADMLYGVTMREEGVSKVLTVKVAEIAGA